MDQELLTTADVAHRLRVNSETVRRLIRTGRLGAIRVGRNFRIPQDEYERYATPERFGETPRNQRQRVRELLKRAS